MKNIKMMIALLLMLSITANVYAKKVKEIVTTDTIKVSGNCDMCKATIEEALNIKGVKKAEWNKDTKILIVSYYASKINNETIQHKVADAGYDTEKFKANVAAYDKLHACCKYERK